MASDARSGPMILALRVERAKPTQSNEERAEKAFCDTERRISRAEYNPFGPLYDLIASIRAEGSAERAKLEQEGQAARDALIEFASRSGVERAKLEAALREIDSYVAELFRRDDGAEIAIGKVRKIVRATLAQPAESGATETSIQIGSHRPNCTCWQCHGA